MLDQAVDALRRWADAHREWIIIGVALPAGTLAGAVERLKSFFRRSSKPSDHDERVMRIQAEVRRYARARENGEAWAQRPLRTDRRGAASLNVRMSDKSASQTVQMSDLTNILDVDEARGVIRVEPFVTVGDAAAYLDARGLQLEATIEMNLSMGLSPRYGVDELSFARSPIPCGGSLYSFPPACLFLCPDRRFLPTCAYPPGLDLDPERRHGSRDDALSC